MNRRRLEQDSNKKAPEQAGAGEAPAEQHQVRVRSKVTLPDGRKLMLTLWASSGFTFRLAEVSTTSVEIERLSVSDSVPPEYTASM